MSTALTIEPGQILRERYRVDRHIKIVAERGRHHVVIQTVVRSGDGWVATPRSRRSAVTVQRLHKEFNFVEAVDG